MPEPAPGRANRHNGNRVASNSPGPASLPTRDFMLPLRELSQRLPLRELSLLASLVGASGVLVWRVQEGRTAVTAQKILIPPIGMATGFCNVCGSGIPLSVAMGSLCIPAWGCCVRLSAAAHIAPGARRRSHHDATFQRFFRGCDRASSHSDSGPQLPSTGSWM